MSERALHACRARIAALRQRPAGAATLGEVTLRRHQVEAASRVREQLDTHGGCLLAEEVGRGKTFVALAVARRWERPLVVVPAALRDTWHRAMARAGCSLPLVTHEALGRGRAAPPAPDGVVVDESHRFRNPRIRRYAALADLTGGAELLLLSATPIQNRLGDLAAQLALFLGSVAATLDAGELARHVVRVDAPDAEARLPALQPPRWLHAGADDRAVLDAILALPAPPLALDAGDAGALRTVGLVRAWASSQAALMSTLGVRRRTVTAMEQCVACGLLPTRDDLRSWTGSAEEGLQLALAPLLATHAPQAGVLASLAVHVAAETMALERLTRLIASRADPDDARADALRSLANGHEGVRILAFTERVGTARAYWRRLASHPSAAMLTASGGRIASGPVSRRALLERFAPAAHGVREPPRRERITLLVCTDVLSEGMNLQDAGIVVHLDLPWNPARLAQRVGRARRPGGAAQVATYLMAPPADSEVVLSVERRLRAKLGHARDAIGRGIDVMPGIVTLAPTDVPGARGHAEALAAVDARVASWAGSAMASAPATGALVACCAAERTGWLACTDDGRLSAEVDGARGDCAVLLDRATECASGPARACVGEESAAAVAAAHDGNARALALASCGQVSTAGDAAQAALRRVAELLRQAPRHERPRLAREAAVVRDALRGPMSLGRERRLARLLAERRIPSVQRFLAAVADVVRRHARTPPRAEGRASVTAVIVFSPRDAGSGTQGGGP